MSSKPEIMLYTDSTPNGIKISMALEELGLPYKFEHIDITTNRQKEPWFLEINPNGRIPAIIDTYDDGQPINIFEGGSILQYLVDRYDPEHKVSFPRGSREAWECNNWLFFQHGGKKLQSRYRSNARSSGALCSAPDKIPYAITRYQKVTRRLYQVVESKLAKSKSGFLVGDHISIADIAALSWIVYGKYVGIDMDEFPAIQKWEEMLSARPGISRGFHVPKELSFKKDGYDPVATEKWAQERAEWFKRELAKDEEK